MSTNKRNLVLFVVLLLMGLGWGVFYWLVIAPTVSG